jgi:adenine deaminase
LILEPPTVEQKRRLMEAARGEVPADSFLKGGTLVNVATRETYEADVAIKEGRIVAVGSDIQGPSVGTKVFDVKGKFLCPGLIETHMHLEASHLSPTQLARAMLVHGTTAISTDFLHSAIVSGIEAVRFLLMEATATPLKILYVVPTPAYCQNRALGLEATPGAPTISDLKEMLSWPVCVGIGETPYEGLIGDDALLDVFVTALKQGKTITGTGTGAVGRKLFAYLVAGASSDHEMTREQEAVEKARLGMHMHIREGSAMMNLAEVIRAITKRGVDPRHFMFCVDEVDPVRLMHIGSIDSLIRYAVREGIDPIVAIQIATLNAAEYFRVDDEIGSISPGKMADVVVVNDLRKFDVVQVFAKGKLVAEGGQFVGEQETVDYPEWLMKSIKLPRALEPSDFEVTFPTNKEEVRARVMGLKEGSLRTEERVLTLKVNHNSVQPDPMHDVLKIATIDRHTGQGRIGVGFVQGFGLKSGAIAESFTNMTEDLVMAGTNNVDLVIAANELARLGGGQIVVDQGKVMGVLPLPLLGLMSNEPLQAVVDNLERMLGTIREMGCGLRSPFATLAFMAVSALGRIKISPKGLMDCEEKKIVPVVVG